MLVLKSGRLNGWPRSLRLEVEQAVIDDVNNALLWTYFLVSLHHICPADPGILGQILRYCENRADTHTSTLELV